MDLDAAKEEIAKMRAKPRQPARIARFVLHQVAVHKVPIEQLGLTGPERAAVDRELARLTGKFNRR